MKTIKIPSSVFIEAIKLAPSIKPNRLTTIHKDDYMSKAIKAVKEDDVLQDILI